MNILVLIISVCRYSPIGPIDPSSMLMTSLPVCAPSTASAVGPATLTLSNLPPELDETAVCRLVAPFGVIQSVGSLPGQRIAVATMPNSIEAVQAAAGLNGLSINGYVMQVTATAAAAAQPPPAQAVSCGNPLAFLQPSSMATASADLSRQPMPFILPPVGAPYELASLAFV